MFFKSIRFKVVLLYIIILTITLLSFGIIIYGSLYKSLYDDFDDLLSSKAEGVVNSINAYWQARDAEADYDMAAPKASEGPSAKEFMAIAQNWVEEKRKAPDPMSIFVQILSPAGERMISSKLMPRIPSLDKEDMEDVLAGEESFDTVRGETFDGRRMKFRICTRPVTEDGRVVYIAQTVGPVELLSVALKNLRLILFVMVPLAIFFAAMPGMLLIKMTLRPVDRMINTLRRITAENLKLKIHIPDTRDEVRRLADTFNDMIERLDRSFSSQQRFIREISQELKSPMQAFKEELDTMLAKEFSLPESSAVLSKASKELGRFSKLIENLLTLSRFDSNLLVLEIKKVNLSSLVESVAGNMRALAGEKGIDLCLACSDKVILDGDEAQLKQLVINLLDNAVKYTKRGGKITVTVSKDNRQATVAVSDTGIGIPEDETDYIFDRFYQVARTRNNDSGGFGLGLSSAKSIVEEHKGAISVESQYGKGSTFIVTLPLSYPG
ncbi:MAG: HAMP domain-containing sensor histidine kinase [Candidatus Omnitrophota bacterium]|nr:HAMP domain-containing sensor histidine kinase [Candidatus Omnitrophota bacterium]